ncbi:MAG: zinc-dependent metalloprotease [Bdellovibrionaceae bacterium]|nr:zinc-dependent metalloprotease [Pseudobdellovibrionaceae bacterium]
MSLFRLFVLLTGVLFLFSCTKEKEIVIERQAPVDIRQSMQPSPDGKALALNKSSLGKAFLLIPSARGSSIAANWLDFMPLVVAFERSGSKVALMELAVHNIYDTIPSEKLLSTFDILSETSDTITIDWTYGLKNLKLAEPTDNPYAQNPLLPTIRGMDPALRIKDNFVRSVSLKGEQIEIEQISRILMSAQAEDDENDKSDEDSNRNGDSAKMKEYEHTLSFYFQLKPYLPNKNFKPLGPDPRGRVGFFTLTGFERERIKPRVMNLHWDFSPERGPVSVILDHGIPEYLKSAVIEGVLYWNRVIGRNALVVRTAERATILPEDRGIVIRWIPWEDAGFAYASMQADPLTGEILRGQVFMTSSWETYSGSLFRAGLGGNKIRSIQALGLVPTRLCDLDQAEYLRRARPPKVEREHQRKAVSDLIRSVIAHEVGHVLGLRHNFAAASSTELSAREQIENRKAYFKELSHPGAPVASSVMDYLSGGDDFLLGAYIRTQELSYDKMAMAWLYGAKEPDHSISKFCTDENVDFLRFRNVGVYGCARFKGMRNPLIGETEDSRAGNLEYFKKNYEYFLEALFSSGKSRNSDEFDSLLQSFTSAPGSFSVGNLMQMLSLRTIDDRDVPTYISIEEAKKDPRALSYVTNFQPDLEKSLREDLIAAGGLDSLLRRAMLMNSGYELDSALLRKTLEDFFAAKEALIKGYTLGGLYFELTDEQFEKIKKAFLSRANQLDHNTLITSWIGAIPVKESTLISQKGVARKVKMRLRSNLGQEIWYPRLLQTVGGVISHPLKVVTIRYKGKTYQAPVRSSARKSLLGWFDVDLMGASAVDVYEVKQKISQQISEVAMSLLLAAGGNEDASLEDIRARFTTLRTEGVLTQELVESLILDIEMARALR